MPEWRPSPRPGSADRPGSRPRPPLPAAIPTRETIADGERRRCRAAMWRTCRLPGRQYGTARGVHDGLLGLLLRSRDRVAVRDAGPERGTDPERLSRLLLQGIC